MNAYVSEKHIVVGQQRLKDKGIENTTFLRDSINEPTKKRKFALSLHSQKKANIKQKA